MTTRFEISGEELRAAGARFEEVADVLAAQPLPSIDVGDLGSERVENAVRLFRDEWTSYARRRALLATVVAATLDSAATDVARADELLTERADRLATS